MGSMLYQAAQAARCDGSYAIILSLYGGPATERANKSGGTFATTQCMLESAEKSHIFIKDEHHRCRAL